MRDHECDLARSGHPFGTAAGTPPRRYTTAGLDPRRRQAHPPALARGVPDGGTATRHGARREDPRRGLLRHGRRGVRAALLRRPPRAPGSGRPDRVGPRRVHLGGALQPARGAVLPAADRAHRRRAGRAADQLLPARGPVRVRRAAAARAPEPRARPGLAGHRPRAEDGARSSCSAPLYTDEIAARLAKLEQAISKQRTVRFRYWTITLRQRGRAHGQPVRPVGDERHLVRRRRRPRPRARRGPAAHVPRLADPRRDQVRHPPRARLPHPGRLQRDRLPRPAALEAVGGGSRDGASSR